MSHSRPPHSTPWDTSFTHHLLVTGHVAEQDAGLDERHGQVGGRGAIYQLGSGRRRAVDDCPRADGQPCSRRSVDHRAGGEWGAIGQRCVNGRAWRGHEGPA